MWLGHNGERWDCDQNRLVFLFLFGRPLQLVAAKTWFLVAGSPERPPHVNVIASDAHSLRIQIETGQPVAVVESGLDPAVTIPNQAIQLNSTTRSGH